MASFGDKHQREHFQVALKEPGTMTTLIMMTIMATTIMMITSTGNILATDNVDVGPCSNDAKEDVITRAT